MTVNDLLEMVAITNTTSNVLVKAAQGANTRFFIEDVTIYNPAARTDDAQITGLVIKSANTVIYGPMPAPVGNNKELKRVLVTAFNEDLNVAVLDAIATPIYVTISGYIGVG